jgi:hypothetical protein
LLIPNSGNLKTRQDRSGNFYVENLTQIEVSSPKEVFKLLKISTTLRSSHSTSLNDSSSRSHLILTLTINTFNQDGSVTSSKLNLVDLAGSERVKDSMVSGQ